MPLTISVPSVMFLCLLLQNSAWAQDGGAYTEGTWIEAPALKSVDDLVLGGHEGPDQRPTFICRISNGFFPGSANSKDSLSVGWEDSAKSSEPGVAHRNGKFVVPHNEFGDDALQGECLVPMKQVEKRFSGEGVQVLVKSSNVTYQWQQFKKEAGHRSRMPTSAVIGGRQQSHGVYMFICRTRESEPILGELSPGHEGSNKTEVEVTRVGSKAQLVGQTEWEDPLHLCYAGSNGKYQGYDDFEVLTAVTSS